MVRCARQQCRPRRVGDGGVVAVGVTGSDGGDRPPQRVGVLGVEAGDEGVGVGHRPHRVEPCRVDDVELVVEHEPAERATGLLNGCFTPEPCGQRLLGGPRGARGGADLFDLVVVVCPAPAVERWRPARSELVGGAQAERIHQPEVRTDRRRRCRRQPHPRDGWVRRRVGDRGAEAVIGPQVDQAPGDGVTDGDAIGLGLAVRNGGQRCHVGRLDDRGRLSRQVVHEDAASGRGDRRLRRGAVRGVEINGERLVAALHRHHRVVDRDPHVGKDRVPLRRRQPGGTERLHADRIPRRDVGVRRPAAATPTVTGDGLAEPDHRRGEQHRCDQPGCSRDLPFHVVSLLSCRARAR